MFDTEYMYTTTDGRTDGRTDGLVGGQAFGWAGRRDELFQQQKR